MCSSPATNVGSLSILSRAALISFSTCRLVVLVSAKDCRSTAAETAVLIDAVSEIYRCSEGDCSARFFAKLELGNLAAVHGNRSTGSPLCLSVQTALAGIWIWIYKGGQQVVANNTV